MTGKGGRFGHVGLPELAEVTVPAPAAAAPPAPEEANMVQLNMKVTAEMRHALRQKALDQGVHLTEALRPVLQAWLDGK